MSLINYFVTEDENLKLTALFKKIDKDGSGFIDKKELV